MSEDAALIGAAKAEIVGLHDFFARWFSGGITDMAEFGRCENALHDAFTMVPPDGALRSRRETLDRIRDGRGAAGADFAIAIEEVAPLWQTQDMILTTYVEAQRHAGGVTRRRSSAVFVRNASIPAGLVWRHLHETWMQG